MNRFKGMLQIGKKNIFIFLGITKQKNFWEDFSWSKWGLKHYVSCAKSIAQVKYISISHSSTGLNISFTYVSHYNHYVASLV